MIVHASVSHPAAGLNVLQPHTVNQLLSPRPRQFHRCLRNKRTRTTCDLTHATAHADTQCTPGQVHCSERNRDLQVVNEERMCILPSPIYLFLYIHLRQEARRQPSHTFQKKFTGLDWLHLNISSAPSFFLHNETPCWLCVMEMITTVNSSNPSEHFGVEKTYVCRYLQLLQVWRLRTGVLSNYSPWFPLKKHF